MLARILALALFLELTLYVVSGFLLARFAAVPMVTVVLSALTVALLLRLLVVSTSFALAAYYRADRRPSLGALGQLELIAAELVAFVALFVFLQPFEPWLARPRRRNYGDSARLPVVLLHGIYCNGAAWWWMGRRLRKHFSTDIYAPSFEPLFADIDDLARWLSRELERICADTGARQVVLVAHSMGGLVARTYISRLKGDRIAKLVTLASPHHGSQHARWSYRRHSIQLRPKSPWLQALNGINSVPTDPPIVSIFSWHDNFVAPQDSSSLTSATNIPMAGMGHLQMFFSRRIEAILRQEIQSAIAIASRQDRTATASQSDRGYDARLPFRGETNIG